MTPVFAARRRAEEFAALVDGSTGGSDARYADLLELVGDLRTVPAATARPAFVASLREQLMAEAVTALVPAPDATARLTLPARKSSRDRRLAAAVGGLALVGATTSMAMAAQSALPGDVLYPIKRAIENAHTGVEMGQGQKGATMLANASGRLDEVSALSRGGDLRDELAIADTLNAFTDQAAEASDLLLSDYAATGHQSSIAELRDFAASSLDALVALEPVVPTDARDELMHAAHVLITIDDAAHQACPSCSGGITDIPPVLAPVSSAVDPAGALTAPAVKPTRATHGSHSHPSVPAVGGDLPPGSVLDPQQQAPSSAPAQQGGSAPAGDPIGSLTQGLTGGGASQPTSSPSLPAVGQILQDAGDTVDDVTGGLPTP
ncbi:MAG: DUF5667 domain-containing protein [Nocardioides sp.]